MARPGKYRMNEKEKLCRTLTHESTCQMSPKGLRKQFYQVVVTLGTEWFNGRKCINESCQNNILKT